jgi:hypothetical protein
MKKISFLLVAAVAVASLTACPSEPPPPPPPPKVEEPPPPPPPPKPTIPAYEPTGDFADLKKGAAAGIDENNAAAKATELEGNLDKAIGDLEAAKTKK